jgi:hypothetical protein
MNSYKNSEGVPPRTLAADVDTVIDLHAELVSEETHPDYESPAEFPV